MRILYVTTISLTMNTFFKPHIKMLVEEGHQVDIACNDDGLPLDKLYSELGCVFHRVDFSRSPLSADNVRAYGQLKGIVAAGSYDIVHCHTPNAAVITRLVCRSFRKKAGLKVFYTAHGFHFYKGAPLLNWLVFYPVEKFCSRFTDKLITINKEDFTRAREKFHAREVHYVPGVGIDLSIFKNVQSDRVAKRREIGVPEDAFLMISVGELSKRKNHMLILQAMSQIENRNIHYIIVGKGILKENLRNYANKNHIAERVHLLGYRRDIAELYKASDLCCFPSLHEGLPVALMEAMASGLPVVCSLIRGNNDLIDSNSGFLVEIDDVEGVSKSILEYVHNKLLREMHSNRNRARVEIFSRDTVLKEISYLYSSD